MSRPWANSQASTTWAGVQLMRFRDLLDGLQQIDIALEVIGAKPGMFPAPILGQERIEVLDRRREKTATERCVRHVADAEFTAGGEDLLFGLAAPQRVFGLEGRHRVNLVRAAQRLRSGFGKRKITRLALLH